MAHQNLTDYERFEQSSARNKALLHEEGLILEVTEAVCEVMQKEGITKAQMARRMGRSKGFITQLLSGDRNLTLRTLANMADALGCHVGVTVSKNLPRMLAGSQSLGVRVTELGRLDHPSWEQVSPEKEPASSRLLSQAPTDENLRFAA